MFYFVLAATELTAAADIGIAIASSPQTTPSKWSSILDDVNSMVDAFPVSPRGTHFAVSTVGSVAKAVLSFNTLRGPENNLNEVKRRISEIPYEEIKTTRLDRGLEQAADEMFTEENGMRKDASKVSVLKGAGPSVPMRWLGHS